MRICMVGYTNFEFDARLHRYAQALLKRGDSVDMIGLGSRAELGIRSVSGVRVFQISSRNLHETSLYSYILNVLQYLWKAFLLLSRLQRQTRYDIIHFHNIPDFGVFCTLIPKIMGSKIILDIHDLVPEFYMRKFGSDDKTLMIRLLKFIERISCRYADHVITVTDIWKERLAQRSISENRCTVIMNLPMESIFQKISFKDHRQGEPFVIRYHGNLAEQTGVDTAIEAIHLIKDKIPEVIFKIIGDGREKESLEKLIQKHGLEKNVIMEGSVPVTKLREKLVDAHLAIDPKRDGVYAGETLSVKSMEYLKLAIPLIVSKTIAARHYFDSSFVRFFEPDNVIELSHAILDLYKHPEKRRDLSVASDRFVTLYSWEKTERTYFALLNRLLIK